MTSKPTDLDNPTESSAELSAVEADVREVVRRGVAPARRSQDGGSEPAGSNIGTLVQRIGGSPIAEIDRLTSELHALRERLQSESARVQRGIIEYARLNESTLQSTKIISENLKKWKN